MPVSECGLSIVSSVPLCFVYSSEGLERGFATFGERMATFERRVFLTFGVCAWEERERDEFCLVGPFL